MHRFLESAFVSLRLPRFSREGCSDQRMGLFQPGDTYDFSLSEIPKSFADMDDDPLEFWLFMRG